MVLCGESTSEFVNPSDPSSKVALCLCYWFRLDAMKRQELLAEIEKELGRAWWSEELVLEDGKWRLKEA